MGGESRLQYVMRSLGSGAPYAVLYLRVSGDNTFVCPPRAAELENRADWMKTHPWEDDVGPKVLDKVPPSRCPKLQAASDPRAHAASQIIPALKERGCEAIRCASRGAFRS